MENSNLIIFIFLLTIFQPNNLVQCEDNNLNMMISQIGNGSSMVFNVTCVTKRNFANSAISTNSPLMTNLTVEKNLHCDQFGNCDSNLSPTWICATNSTIITDKRWENFPVEKYLRIKLFDTLTSKNNYEIAYPFSVRSQNGFKLIIEDKRGIAYELAVDENFLIFSKAKNKSQYSFSYQNNQWNTYSLYLFSNKSTTLISLKNKQQSLWKFIDQTNPIIPSLIKTEGEANWKLHSYNTPFTTNPGRTISPFFKVSSVHLYKPIYFTLYFLMCENCALNISIHIQEDIFLGSINNKGVINGTNSWKWKRFKHQVKQISDLSYLIFQTIRVDDNIKEDLFWAIDQVKMIDMIQELNSQSSIVEIPGQIPNLESINCQLVREKSVFTKWSLPSTSSFDQFCSNSFLRSQCGIECDDSPTFQSCRGVTFCSPGECFCAPGYNGTNCNDSLTEATAENKTLIVLLCFFVVILLVVLVIIFRFICKKDSHKLQYHSQIRYDPSSEKLSEVHLLEDNLETVALIVPTPVTVPALITQNGKSMRKKSLKKNVNWKPTVSKDGISMLIPLENFYDYVKNCINNGSLDKQYELLARNDSSKTSEYGSFPQNKSKNRYGNLIAYDETRVILEKLPNDPFSDYINANFISGFDCKNAYIATQGPTSKTVNDFWRMVWQENVKCIVMLTNVEESGQKKCLQYWPKVNETSVYGEIAVFLENLRVFSDYVCRTFKVTFEKVDRTVEQLHFTTWPDHGVPTYPKNLVPLLKSILDISPSSPIVVHCSAGVGRTGTIILTDICLRMALSTKTIDILAHLQKIRKQRSHMVNNLDQFKLVHLLLIECLLVENTSIDCSDLENDVQKLLAKENFLQNQFDEIKEQMWMDQAMNINIVFKNKGEFKTKNRFPTILPERIGVSTMGVSCEDNAYINAIFVDGYRNKNQFIVTQQPLPNTLADFWVMIIENNVTCIVSLNHLNLNDPTVASFYPENEYVVELTPEINMQRLSLTCFEYYQIIYLLLTDKTKKKFDKLYITLIQVKDWSFENEIPFKHSENFVKLWDETEKACNSYPIVVTCYDGLTASGLFVAQAFIIDKIKFEQQCDVSLAVRTIRHNRSAFIKSKEQLAYLYKAAVSYVNSFQTYSNFQK